MDGYMLYRKQGHTALVLIAENDDELHYVLAKLHKSRIRWLKDFAKGLLIEYFKETNTNEKE